MNDGRSAGPGRNGTATAVGGGSGMILETVVSPFHCLYQDALEFHKQSHLRRPRSESEASRLARAALVLYVAAAESLVHQAAAELGRPELARLVGDPSRPLPLLDAWRLLPALAAAPSHGPGDPEAPPWPQFAELLALRSDWSYPGPEANRRAYYRRGAGRTTAGSSSPWSRTRSRRAWTCRPSDSSIPGPACPATRTLSARITSTPPAVCSMPPSPPSTGSSTAP